MVPYGLEIEKTFSSQGKSENFEQTGKSGNFTQNTGTMKEFYPKYWKSEDIVASFYFYFYSDFLIEVYLINKFLCLLNSSNKTLKKKILENGKKKVREICQSESVGSMDI